MCELKNRYEGTNVSEVTLEVVEERLRLGFKRLEDRFDVNDKVHDAIIERQDKTNGNVTRLERWMYQLLGAGAVLTILGAMYFACHDHIRISF